MSAKHSQHLRSPITGCLRIFVKRNPSHLFRLNIDDLYLTPSSGSYIQTAVSEHFLSNSHSASHMLLIPIEALRYERDCLRKAREAHLIHKAKTIEPLGINKLDELALCNRYLFFGLFFLAATPYHVLPCNFCLLLYSSIFSVYSWFFLINLMKTGIGQSNYCISQPFSRCLVSLCTSLFSFNSIFIFLDWSRSCLIQRWATLIVHGCCSGFSSLNLHYSCKTYFKIIS